YDAQRTAKLEAMGYTVMRFWNHEILGELDSVLERIALVLNEIPSPQPFYTRRVLPEGEGVSLVEICRF
ncbi:MAG: DUF559 domain-containing protein, partial [Chromatiales bacterium]|nr:DUF559 domain-containing protein [Chromatiales bacterium]